MGAGASRLLEYVINVVVSCSSRKAGWGGCCEGRGYWANNRGCILQNVKVEIMIVVNDEKQSLSNELLVADFYAFDEILAA